MSRFAQKIAVSVWAAAASVSPLPAAAQAQSTASVDARESRRIVTDRNAALILIDHQPQTLFAIQSHDRQTLVNNVAALAKTAKAFRLPVVLTTVAAESFTGPLIPEVRDVYPDAPVIDRSSLNAWVDIADEVKATGRKKLIMAGMWTELCLTLPVLSALEAGYEVYIVTDASGSPSREAHDMGVQRMVQAGAVPVTWVGMLSELQYDWARKDTYEAVTSIAREHGGAFGAGVNFVRSMRSVEGQSRPNRNTGNATSLIEQQP